MPRKISNKVFVVVQVMAGVAVDAHCFCNMRVAEKFAKKSRLECDENDDDVQIFEATVQDDS